MAFPSPSCGAACTSSGENSRTSETRSTSRPVIWTSLPEARLDDQDAGCPARTVFLRQAERKPQIVDRHDVPAEVDHSQQKLRPAGHLGQRLHVEDFLDPHHFERIAFSAQSKHDVRLRAIAIGGGTGVHHDIDHHPTLMIAWHDRTIEIPGRAAAQPASALESRRRAVLFKDRCCHHENRSKFVVVVKVNHHAAAGRTARVARRRRRRRARRAPGAKARPAELRRADPPGPRRARHRSVEPCVDRPARRTRERLDRV